MKKRASIFVASLLVVTAGLPASAAPTAWSSCSKLGQVVKIAGANFHCIKTARGNFAFAPANMPNGSAAPIPGGSGKSDAKVDPVTLAAYNAFDHKACLSTHPNIVANYFNSPGYSKTMLASQKSLFETSMNCFSAYFNRKITVNLYFGTEKDYDWFANSTNSSGNKTFSANQLQWLKFRTDAIAKTANGNGNRAAGSAEWDKPSDSAWVLMLDSTFNSTPNVHMAAHEFVHILQSFSRASLFDSYSYDQTPANHINMPAWFWEGTAELFSFAAISTDVNHFSADIGANGTDVKENISLNKISSTDDVIKTFSLLNEPQGQEANSMSYSLGRIECEYILATYGYAKYQAIMKNAGSYKDFSENLKTTLGLSTLELLSKSAPFVLSQWKLAKF